jgi:cell cycle arrest protein BUB2
MCVPPLEEALKLWDFLLCYGVHLNVICLIAQYVLLRDEILASTR